MVGFIGLAAAVAAVIGLAIGLGGGTKRPTYHAALGGTALAPGASGQVTLVQTVSGWQVTLHAKGLPRLDNGQFYQAWLKNQAGILVPIGTFNQPNDVTLWSGVPPTQFPVITVTRQKANGNLNSSGQRVLTGTAQRAGKGPAREAGNNRPASRMGREGQHVEQGDQRHPVDDFTSLDGVRHPVQRHPFDPLRLGDVGRIADLQSVPSGEEVERLVRQAAGRVVARAEG